MSSRYSDKTKPIKRDLSPELNAAARRYTRALVDDDFAGNVLACAHAIGIAQGTLYDFLKGAKGAGARLLDAVARYRGVSVDVVLGRAPARRIDLLEGHAPPRELSDAMREREWSHVTTVQLRLFALFIPEPLPTDEWLRIGDGYERENQAAALRQLRARKLPMSAARAPNATKRKRA